MYYITQFNLDTFTVGTFEGPFRDFVEAQEKLKWHLRNRIYKYLGKPYSSRIPEGETRDRRTEEIYQAVINSQGFQKGRSLFKVPFYTFETGFLKCISTSFWLTDSDDHFLTGEVWNIINQPEIDPVCVTL